MSIPSTLGWVELTNGKGYWVPHSDRSRGKFGGGGRLVVSNRMINELENVPVHQIPVIIAGGNVFEKSFDWHEVVVLRSWRNEVILPYLKMRML